MNDKSKTEKTAFELSKEEFQQMLEKQERSKPLEDEALEQFVKKPKKLNLYDKIISSVDFILLFFLFCVIFIFSIVSNGKTTKPYVAIPIAILSIIGIILLIKEVKRNDKENNKKYK